MGAEDYIHFIISSANYPVFYKNKNVDAYLMFYNKEYLPE
jgi:hypothetical protein